MAKRDTQDGAERVSPTGLCLCGCGAVTPVAERTQYRPLGTIKGRPAAYLAGHRIRGRRRLDMNDLWRENPDTECWVWQAAIQPSGYGEIRANGTTELAHRWVWELHVGPLPPRRHLHHRCDNRACVNPAHLAIVTPKKHAELHAKLTSDARKMIIKRVRAGELQRVVAADFSITPQYAGQLANRAVR